MDNSSYIKFHREFTETMAAVTFAKNKDYGGGVGNDAFQNIRMAEKINLCSAEQAVLVRICDKVSRLTNFVQSGTLEVKAESAWDSCIDAANYFAILAALIKEKAGNRDYNPQEIV